MLDTYLSEGQESIRWKNQQRFIDILCWSIEPKFIQQDRSKLGNILRFLIDTLREGLQQIDMPSDAIEQIINAIEPYHYASLHGQDTQETAGFLKEEFPDDEQFSDKSGLIQSITELQEAIKALPDVELPEFETTEGSDKVIMEDIVLQIFTCC